ncbi:hypothetical protein Cantr_08098 [Candida viswanathii]|uniref:LysM domain-containing protein n=1 Tax=Candida viswanathii TaxID=5486 RepID=A0A367Y7D9_9ASCO|nr:hypothetical protein Cantr_08098 [Candida viswanathii]
MRKVLFFSILPFFHSPISAELRNCNLDPLSDHCDNVYTWRANDTCDEVTERFNLSAYDIEDFNSVNDNSIYCDELSEGDQICLSKVNYLGCGNYDVCKFEDPEYFCDTYTIDKDNMTCQEISNMFGISVTDFKEFNKHNYNGVECTPEWFIEGEVYCVSKPNFTDWDNCMALAIAEGDTYYASLYATEIQTIMPLDASPSATKKVEYYYNATQSEFTTRSYNITSALVTSLSTEFAYLSSEYSYLSSISASVEAVYTSVYGPRHTNATGIAAAGAITSIDGSVSTSASGSATGSTVAQGDASALKMFGLTFVIAFISCVL